MTNPEVGEVANAIALIQRKMEKQGEKVLKEKVSRIIGRCTAQKIEFIGVVGEYDHIRVTEPLRIRNDYIMLAGRFSGSQDKPLDLGQKVHLMKVGEASEYPVNPFGFIRLISAEEHDLATFSDEHLWVPHMKVPDDETLYSLGVVVDYIDVNTAARLN